MLELLGMLGGGVFRLVPFLVDFFKAKRDADHEYRMTELQLKVDQARAAQAIDLANAQAAIALGQGEMEAWGKAIDAQGRPSGISWIDAISATVRPFLTYYWVVGLYGSAKVIQVIVAFRSGAPLDAFVPILVTEFDRTVIGSMLSFWFVDRALRKAR